MLATSDPASGSVIARHILFFPSNISGMSRSCSPSFPNLSNGGTAYDMPVTSEAEGPPKPDRDICPGG